MPETGRYSRASVAIHWLSLVLIAAVYCLMEFREYWPKGDPVREGMKAWHYTLGLTVLAITLGRIVVRLANPAPPIVPEPPQWQRMLARVVHLALYALLLAMPLMGWLILSAEGETIPFWGFELPALAAKSKDFAELVEDWHETGGKIGYALIGLHAAASLFHHYVVRDNTLARMMPGTRRLG
jgi:cytochrome b561